MQIPQITCKRCGHTWILRVQDPVRCPFCKNHLKNWKEAGTIPPRTAPAVASSGGT